MTQHNEESGVQEIKFMGILNVTPDSFSDGGNYDTVDSALDQAMKLIDSGADILDIGGESTRPYSSPVSLEEELLRTIPVIERIRAHSDIPISIDTTKAEVARQAFEAGATILNDISAMQKDSEMTTVACHYNVPVVIMHMQNTPENMQDNPQYSDVIAEITAFFSNRLTELEKEGIKKEKIIIDPGIGFGKSSAHNLFIIKHLREFTRLGCPVLLGHSRKGFLGEITGKAAPGRDLETAVVSAFASNEGISILRVHDVAASRDAVKIYQAILLAYSTGFESLNPRYSCQTNQ